MRVAVVNEIYKLMKKNKNIYFLIGDLGYTAVEQIEKDFPDRFINVGVAEQNMLGIAAGLALSRKKVYVYSVISFLIMRSYEQIRDDICYHNLDVTVLGVGGGMSYGYLSSTHFALEDIAIMRVLPNMSIFSPADEIEASLGIKALEKYKYPLYIRIGKRREPIIYKKRYEFTFGRGKILRRGSDITIFSTGPLIDEVIKAVDTLEKTTKLKITLVNLHTLKPLDKQLILKCSLGKKIVFSIEEHYKNGGLGSAIAEILIKQANSPRLKIIGVPNSFIKELGSQSYLRKRLGLNAEGIKKTIVSTLQKF